MLSTFFVESISQINVSNDWGGIVTVLLFSDGLSHAIYQMVHLSSTIWAGGCKLEDSGMLILEKFIELTKAVREESFSCKMTPNVSHIDRSNAWFWSF